MLSFLTSPLEQLWSNGICALSIDFDDDDKDVDDGDCDDDRGIQTNNTNGKCEVHDSINNNLLMKHLLLI